MTPPLCQVCRFFLREGQVAWSSEWKVLQLDGTVRTETRYTCDDCEQKKKT